MAPTDHRFLLLSFTLLAILAIQTDSHGLENFPAATTTTSNANANPEMASFFGAYTKPEAAALPEALNSALLPPVSTTSTTSPATVTDNTETLKPSDSTVQHRRASVSVPVAVGVAVGVVALVAVVGIAVVVYVVKGRKSGASEVQLGSP